MEQIENATFHRKTPTVAEYCEKWLLMQSVHVRATTLTDYTSKVRRHIIAELGDVYEDNGALLYLDLDDFKHINDGLGHQYGDVLLKSISHALKRINGIENTCYRMGGDEFVIIIPPDSYPRFGNIVEDIKKIFSKPWFLKDADYYCTMSMGIVTFPDAGDSVTDLIKKADG